MRSVLAAALLAATATARLDGFAVPETIKPGDTIAVTFLNEIYIQTVYDVAFVLGWSPGDGIQQSIGSPITSVYLGPDLSNQVHNLTFHVDVPDNIPKGEATVSVSLMSLYGVGGMPTLSNWNASVTFGDVTSETLVRNN